MRTKLTAAEISDEIDALEMELSNIANYWEQRDIERQIDELQEDLHAIWREDCLVAGEHNKRVISERGYDVCSNCGSKS